MIHDLRIACALPLLLEIPDYAFTYLVILDRRISWRARWVHIMDLGDDQESESRRNAVKIVKRR
jgi:hypothetical protein